MPYAENTTVSPERSQMEIAALVSKYGATRYAHGWEYGRAAINFTAKDRHIRFILDLPTDPRAFRLTAQSRARTPTQAQEAMQAEIRRRWRALALVIKAKLEAVETGIVTFDEEFAAHIVMPDGTTVGERLVPEIARAYASGITPPNLLALPAGRSA